MPGDVVLLPTNTPHALVSEPDGETLAFGSLEKRARQTADGDVLIDGAGARTRVLCASYDYDHDVAHPLLSQLPPVLHVGADTAGGDDGVAATLRLLALELGDHPPGSRAAVARLIDVMLIHVLRAWQRTQESAEDGSWLVALRDPVVAGALARIHARPGEPWTVDSLAAEVNVSRATLARRFRTSWMSRRSRTSHAGGWTSPPSSCATPTTRSAPSPTVSATGRNTRSRARSRDIAVSRRAATAATRGSAAPLRSRRSGHRRSAIT